MFIKMSGTVTREREKIGQLLTSTPPVTIPETITGCISAPGLLNSFDAFFRVSRQVLVCLPFTGGNIFLPMADNQTFSVFISKVQNDQGILLFVHRNLARES